MMLIQVTAPSWPDMDEYHRLRDQVNGLVGEINGKYGLLRICTAPTHAD